MSNAVTHDDIHKLDAKIVKLDIKVDTMSKKIRSEMRESFDDVTALLQTFMSQVDDRFNDIEELRDDVNQLFSNLDGVTKRQEINDDERLVMGRQLDRLDKWMHKVADEIGYKLIT